MSRKNVAPVELPDIILDPTTKKRYKRGKFMGKVSLYLKIL